MIELENCHFKTLNEVIYLSNDHQLMIKPPPETFIKPFIIERSCC